MSELKVKNNPSEHISVSLPKPKPDKGKIIYYEGKYSLLTEAKISLGFGYKVLVMNEN